MEPAFKEPPELEDGSIIGELKLWPGPLPEIEGGGHPFEAIGWFLCDGSEVNRWVTGTNATKLFRRLGDTFGVGDGTTTFNLPDFRDRSPMGATRDDENRAYTTVEEGVQFENGVHQKTRLSGHATHKLQEEGMPTHDHGTTSSGSAIPRLEIVHAAGDSWNQEFATGHSRAGNVGHTVDAPSVNYQGQQHTHQVGPKGYGLPHNNLHPYFAVWYLIFGGAETRVVSRQPRGKPA